jgi:hypothetical protein
MLIQSPNVSLAVVIPTRNRASLAEQTLRSVLDADSRTPVLVSDNSADLAERDRLASVCEGLAREGRRVRYVQTPRSLPMSQHWDWALERATELLKASHFTFITDRGLAKAEGLPALLRVCTLFPDDVVMFSEDWIVDDTKPIRLVAVPWSDKVTRLTCDHLLERASQMKHHPLPRMMNCAVPRPAITAIRHRFGTVFDSASPDFNFAFRCLALRDSVLYFDRPVVALHAFYRSNGAAVSRGDLTGDTADFMSMVPSGTAKAPAPFLQTVSNGIVHEYLSVAATGAKRFPPLNMNAYYGRLRAEVSVVRDPTRRQEMSAYLDKVGAPRAAGRNAVSAVLSLGDWAVSATNGLWQWLARSAGLYPPVGASLRFDSGAASLRFLQKHPRTRHRLAYHLYWLLGRSFETVGDSQKRREAPRGLGALGFWGLGRTTEL